MSTPWRWKRRSPRSSFRHDRADSSRPCRRIRSRDAEVSVLRNAERDKPLQKMWARCHRAPPALHALSAHDPDERRKLRALQGTTNQRVTLESTADYRNLSAGFYSEHHPSLPIVAKPLPKCLARQSDGKHRGQMHDQFARRNGVIGMKHRFGVQKQNKGLGGILHIKY